MSYDNTNVRFNINKIMKKILELNSEIESQRISAILNENNIDFVIKKYKDSSFSGVYESQFGFGDLYVNEKDMRKAALLIKEVDSDYEVLPKFEDKDSNNKKDKNKKVLFTSIVILILIASNIYFVIKYFDYKDILEGENYEGVFVSKWVNDMKVLKTNWASNSNTAFIQYDDNFNDVFERMDTYNQNGELTDISYDTDENGIIELSEQFKTDGKLKNKYYDRNQDMLVDSIIMYERSDIVQIYIDNNFDDIFDSLLIYDTEMNLINTFRYSDYLDLLKMKN